MSMISKLPAETIAILSTGISTCLWMNGKFNAIESRFNEIDRRLVRIESVMYIRGLHPGPNTALDEEVKSIKREVKDITFLPKI